MESLADEVELVKAVVGRFFPIYEVRVRPEALAFYVRVDASRLSESFEGLRLELKERSYIPILREEGGEHVLFVQRKPQARFRGPILNLALLIATLASTVYAGMLLWSGSYGADGEFLSLSTVANAALFFAVPLMAILGTHEMGHYLLARKHGVAASLPFFIPAPFTLIGTLGALISMREPIPNKKALLDIGIAGPLAGLAVAFPITLLGLQLNAMNPVATGPNVGGGLGINFPLIYYLFFFLIPLPEGIVLHPTVVAGWVGFFVTAINLLPAGQLDGGHVARALLGEKSRYLSYAAFVALLIMGFQFFLSWIILAFFVLLIGLRHPPPLNDITKIHIGRKSLGLAVLAVLILSFVPQPLVQIPASTHFEFRSWEDPATALPFNESEGVYVDSVALDPGVYSVYLNNTGNVALTLELRLLVQNLPGWNIMFTSVGGREIQAQNATLELNAGEAASAIVLISAPPGVDPGQTFTVTIAGQAEGAGGRHEESLELTILT